MAKQLAFTEEARKKLKNGIDRVAFPLERARVTNLAGPDRPRGHLAARLRVRHETGDRINQMDVITEFRQPKCVYAGTAPDVENCCRRFRKSFEQQFLRTLKFQLRSTRAEPLMLRRIFVITPNLGTDFHLEYRLTLVSHAHQVTKTHFQEFENAINCAPMRSHGILLSWVDKTNQKEKKRSLRKRKPPAGCRPAKTAFPRTG